MKTFQELGRVGRVVVLLAGFGLGGCASQHATVHFASAQAPVAGVIAAEPAPRPEAVSVASAAASPEAAPEPAIAIGPLSDANIALLDGEREVDLEVGFQLAQHVPASLPFHCLTGEESLGCNATPAAERVEEQPRHEEPVALASSRSSREGEVR